MRDPSIVKVYRGNLLRKAQEAKAKGDDSDFLWYSKLGWTDALANGYVW